MLEKINARNEILDILYTMRGLKKRGTNLNRPLTSMIFKEFSEELLTSMEEVLREDIKVIDQLSKTNHYDRSMKKSYEELLLAIELERSKEW